MQACLWLLVLYLVCHHIKWTVSIAANTCEKETHTHKHMHTHTHACTHTHTQTHKHAHIHVHVRVRVHITTQKKLSLPVALPTLWKEGGPEEGEKTPNCWEEKRGLDPELGPCWSAYERKQTNKQTNKHECKGVNDRAHYEL